MKMHERITLFHNAFNIAFPVDPEYLAFPEVERILDP